MNDQKLAQSLFVQLVTCTIGNSILLRGLLVHCGTFLKHKEVCICDELCFYVEENQVQQQGFCLALINCSWPLGFKSLLPILLLSGDTFLHHDRSKCKRH